MFSFVSAFERYAFKRQRLADFDRYGRRPLASTLVNVCKRWRDVHVNVLFWKIPPLGTQQCFSFATTTMQQHVRASVTKNIWKMLRPRCPNRIAAINIAIMQQQNLVTSSRQCCSVPSSASVEIKFLLNFLTIQYLDDQTQISNMSVHGQTSLGWHRKTF